MNSTNEKEELQKVDSKAALINAIKADFATSVNKIYINSLKKEIGFREITVKEQKTLSRIMIDNESKGRKDIVYDAQCALINTACLEPEEFDIYKLTEFDRLKLLIAIYQANMFKNDIKFTCEECGAENVYKLDFQQTLQKLDDVSLDTQTFQYENKLWKYDFTLDYPSVKRVLEFHKSNVGKYKNMKKTQQSTIDNMQNMDYVDLYISSIKIFNKTNKTEKFVDLNEFNAGEVEDVISIFPQDVLYSEDGVIKYVVDNFISKINASFEEQTCYNCGAKTKTAIGNSESFL